MYHNYTVAFEVNEDCKRFTTKYSEFESGYEDTDDNYKEALTDCVDAFCKTNSIQKNLKNQDLQNTLENEIANNRLHTERQLKALCKKYNVEPWLYAYTAADLVKMRVYDELD